MRNIRNNLSRQLLLIIFLIISLFYILIGVFLPRQLLPLYEKNIYEYLKQPLDFIDKENLNTQDQEIGYIYIYNNNISISNNFTNIINTKDIDKIIEKSSNKYGNFKYKTKTYYYYKNIDRINNTNVIKISITNDNYIKELKKDSLLKYFPIILFTVLTVSLIFILWSYSIVKRIERLKKKIENIDNDDYDHNVSNKEDDELSSLERMIEDMRKQLINQEEYRNTMYQNISHDFKTPITVIKSYMEAKKDDLIDEETFNKVINEQIEKLEDKVHALLYLNKLDYIKDIKNKDFELIDIIDIINKSIEKFKYRNKNIKFTVITDKKFKYYGTTDFFEAVVDNLLSNFIRYAKTEIKITVKKDKIIFYNDGNNIDDKLIESIFIPFRKGIKGEFGLGLSIVKKSLNYMNYDINIKNNKKGVSFIITRK